MNDSTVFMKCPACGAVNRLNVDKRCWVCEQPLRRDKAVWLEFGEDQKRPAQSAGFSGGAMAMIGVVLLVGVGLTVLAPGLGIMLLILSIIPVIRTLTLVDPAANPEKAASLYITSVLVSVVIVVVLGAVAFGSFCLTLFGVCALDQQGVGEASAVLWAIPTVAVLLTAIPLGMWVISRWQRDKHDR